MLTQLIRDHIGPCGKHKIGDIKECGKVETCFLCTQENYISQCPLQLDMANEVPRLLQDISFHRKLAHAIV